MKEEDRKLGIDLDEIHLCAPGERNSIDCIANLISSQHKLLPQLAHSSDELAKIGLRSDRSAIEEQPNSSWIENCKLLGDRVNWQTMNIKTKISLDPIVSILIIKHRLEDRKACKSKQLTLAFVTIERQKFRFNNRF